MSQRIWSQPRLTLGFSGEELLHSQLRNDRREGKYFKGNRENGIELMVYHVFVETCSLGYNSMYLLALSQSHGEIFPP